MQCAQTRNQITSIFFPQYHSLISVVSSVIVAMIDQLKLDVAVTNYYYSIVVKSSKNVLQKKFSLCCLLRCKFFPTFSFKIHYMFISIHSFILQRFVGPQGPPDPPGILGRTVPRTLLDPAPRRGRKGLRGVQGRQGKRGMRGTPGKSAQKRKNRGGGGQFCKSCNEYH